MRLLGVETVDKLGMQHVGTLHPLFHDHTLTISQINTRTVEHQIYDGPSGLDSLRDVFRAKL